MGIGAYRPDSLSNMAIVGLYADLCSSFLEHGRLGCLFLSHGWVFRGLIWVVLERGAGSTHSGAALAVLAKVSPH